MANQVKNILPGHAVLLIVPQKSYLEDKFLDINLVHSWPDNISLDQLNRYFIKQCMVYLNFLR